MKVLIIAGASLRYCPYANFYINIFQDNKIFFDVIYPDRSNLNDFFPYSTIVYNWNNKKNKYLELNNFKKFVNGFLDKGEYDCVVTLTTVISVLFYSSLKKRGIKYIVDIRDYTYENVLPYYLLEKKAIQGAAGTFISSPGFRKFLPNSKYIDVFNAPNAINIYDGDYITEFNSNSIKISYIGTIAYPVQCELLMKLVENDDRFVFCLYGNDLNGNRIQSFIDENHLKNSKYFGPYSPEEKEKIILESDILFNAYGNSSDLLKYALSNKLTDAVMYYKPVLNSPETSMNEVLGEISYAIDLANVDSLDGLYSWYQSLNDNIIKSKANEIIERIKETNENAKTTLLSIVNN